MKARQWNAGDTLTVVAHTSAPGKGLTYPAMTVRAAEAGAVGGWDVYDGHTAEGNEVSFYGFSVVRIKRGPRA